MGLETADRIADLNKTWPLGSDPKAEGDDHLRLIKSVLQSDPLTKDNATGKVTIQPKTGSKAWIEFLNSAGTELGSLGYEITTSQFILKHGPGAPNATVGAQGEFRILGTSGSGMIYGPSWYLRQDTGFMSVNFSKQSNDDNYWQLGYDGTTKITTLKTDRTGTEKSHQWTNGGDFVAARHVSARSGASTQFPSLNFLNDSQVLVGAVQYSIADNYVQIAVAIHGTQKNHRFDDDILSNRHVGAKAGVGTTFPAFQFYSSGGTLVGAVSYSINNTFIQLAVAINGTQLNHQFDADFTSNRHVNVKAGASTNFPGLQFLNSGGVLIGACQYSIAGNYVQISNSINGTQRNFQFQSDGNAAKLAAGQWNAISDARIKQVDGDYLPGLAEVEAMRVRVFEYKGNDTVEIADGVYDSPHADLAGVKFVGFIAQELEAILPEAVTRGPGRIDGETVDDLRQVDPTNVMYALVNAVKTLSARVAELEASLVTR